MKEDFKQLITVPLSVQWHITTACNNKCKHCYMYAEETYENEKKNTLPLKDLIKILDDFESFEKKYNATSHRFSASLRDILNRLNLEVNRKNIQILSNKLREGFGQDLLAKVMSEDVKNDNNKIVIIDGIRRPADIKYLSKMPEFKLVYITADIKTRYKRLIKRGENTDDNIKTFKQFKEDHKAEADREIPNVGKTAKIKIKNNGTIKNLHTQIDKTIKEILK